nr:amidohydrolase family protein [Variovorax boronicumulans]
MYIALRSMAAFDYGAESAPPTSDDVGRLWRPIIETCIDGFGADRAMFESNFPVEKQGMRWATLWNAFKKITAGASPAEKAALFSGTETRVYRLSALRG